MVLLLKARMETIAVTAIIIIVVLPINEFLYLTTKVVLCFPLERKQSVATANVVILFRSRGF